MAAQNGGSSLHGGALLGLVESGDAVGDRLDDGATTLLQRHRGSAVGGLVGRWKGGGEGKASYKLKERRKIKSKEKKRQLPRC